jgi:hypothetical protein
MLSAYGEGPRPILRWTAAPGWGVIVDMDGERCRDVVIEHLAFDSIHSEFTGRDICTAIRPAGHHIAVRDCVFGHVTDAINTNRQPHGVLSQHNLATDLRAYYLWAQGRDHVHLGNVVRDSMHEHNIRFGGVERILIAHNDLAHTDPEHPKRCLWVMNGRHAWVMRNVLRRGRLTVGPDHVGGDPNARFRFCVLEANLLEKRTAETAAIELEHGAEHVMVRNNVIRTAGNSSIAIRGYDEQMNRTTRDVRIFNNTAICAGEVGRFLHVGTDAENLRVANNLFIAPRIVTGDYQSAFMFVLEDDLEPFAFVRDNVWPVPSGSTWQDDAHHYVYAYWAHPDGVHDQAEWSALAQTSGDAYAAVMLGADYRPAPGSAASHHAQPVPGVFTDYYGLARPPAAWTAGAVESEQ